MQMQMMSPVLQQQTLQQQAVARQAAGQQAGGGNPLLTQFVRRLQSVQERRVLRPGDWQCAHCGNQNYANRVDCNRCGRNIDNHARPTGLEVVRATQPGDWLCEHCQNHNFADKARCNRCQVSRPEQPHPVPAQALQPPPQEAQLRLRRAGEIRSGLPAAPGWGKPSAHKGRGGPGGNDESDSEGGPSTLGLGVPPAESHQAHVDVVQQQFLASLQNRTARQAFEFQRERWLRPGVGCLAPRLEPVPKCDGGVPQHWASMVAPPAPLQITAGPEGHVAPYQAAPAGGSAGGQQPPVQGGADAHDERGLGIRNVQLPEDKAHLDLTPIDRAPFPSADRPLSRRYYSGGAMHAWHEEDVFNDVVKRNCGKRKVTVPDLIMPGRKRGRKEEAKRAPPPEDPAPKKEKKDKKRRRDTDAPPAIRTASARELGDKDALAAERFLDGLDARCRMGSRHPGAVESALFLESISRHAGRSGGCRAYSASSLAAFSAGFEVFTAAVCAAVAAALCLPATEAGLRPPPPDPEDTEGDELAGLRGRLSALRSLQAKGTDGLELAIAALESKIEATAAARGAETTPEPAPPSPQAPGAPAGSDEGAAPPEAPPPQLPAAEPPVLPPPSPPKAPQPPARQACARARPPMLGPLQMTVKPGSSPPLVDSVYPYGNCRTAGILVGDRVVRVNFQAVRTREKLLRECSREAGVAPGATVQLSLQRRKRDLASGELLETVEFEVAVQLVKAPGTWRQWIRDADAAAAAARRPKVDVRALQEDVQQLRRKLAEKEAELALEVAEA
eukprot:TRINITY_DN18090_c0_g1_i1.p1 TRINITY_DN18090_c0_g1~~TRINITY_DN18090_c0_g1_i1.p1  ORF type:complete len:787 (+),score=244.02 TRINITY_DN18090_c0_g1_i1:92-2452(+)